MIGSMTQEERENPDLLASQPSRRRRIAKGSGHKPGDMDKVLADFQKMRGFMQQMSRGGGMPGMGGFPGMGGPQQAAKAYKPAKKRKGFGQL